ncbi:unnamed protein product [Echinostoma caproni]|uniref:Transmembrane protein n=1 Tax=Echinostoma caproni TaxID=27848 RepID=A0A183A073_9TREM|nr:unnamed protein product [Echinostoma caproni]
MIQSPFSEGGPSDNRCFPEVQELEPSRVEPEGDGQPEPSEREPSPVERSETEERPAETAESWVEALSADWMDPADAEEVSHDNYSEIEMDSSVINTTFLRPTRLDQDQSARRLHPFWWIFYQSRWPIFLAPRHLVQVKRFQQKNYFSRASCLVLRSDLFRWGIDCDKAVIFLLIDPLVSFYFAPCILFVVITISFKRISRDCVACTTCVRLSDASIPFTRNNDGSMALDYHDHLIFYLLLNGDSMWDWCWYNWYNSVEGFTR